MTKGLPPFVTEFHDRHGKLRWRFRRAGFPSAYISASPGTDEFIKQYNALKSGDRPSAGGDKMIPGTFHDLIARYYRSTAWTNIPKDSTRKVYRGVYERFREKYGDRKVATMTAWNISRLMETMSDTPGAAAILLKRLRQLFDYAILMGIRTDNPAKPVKPPKSKRGGFHTWDEAEIAAFEARHAIGTRARLALALLLYTAQRRSDVHIMGRQQVKDGRITVRQLKTDKLLRIPIHPELQKAIDACPSGHLAYIVSNRGAPYTAESFSNWFRRRAREAGLTDCPAHGLRKASARRMAEMGLSNQLIKSITGHTMDSRFQGTPKTLNKS
ncbi:MAG TPA: tyrosine-type recombinase/integrase [Sphingobium sp.]